MSDLLLFDWGGATPPDITSSSNRMLVEFESPVTSNPDLVAAPEGFVAVFSTKGKISYSRFCFEFSNYSIPPPKCIEIQSKISHMI